MALGYVQIFGPTCPDARGRWEPIRGSQELGIPQDDGGWVGIPVLISARIHTGGDKGIQGLKGSTTNDLDVRLEGTHCKRINIVTAWSSVEGGLHLSLPSRGFTVDGSPFSANHVQPVFNGCS